MSKVIGIDLQSVLRSCGGSLNVKTALMCLSLIRRQRDCMTQRGQSPSPLQAMSEPQKAPLCCC